MSTPSCLYEGAIHHARFDPPREFRHHLAMAYIDLEELPELLDGRLVARAPGLVRFRRRDYLGDPRTTLKEAVRDLAERHTGRRPAGPVRLLTQLRSFGHCFNPVSFYYCLNEAATQIEVLIAEVTNTPWGERQAYVIPGGAGRFDKALHVSPFLGMEHAYACRSSVPTGALSVRIENWSNHARVFAAGLTLRRRELTPASLRSVTVRYPFATIRVLGLIYMHALGLRLTGAQVFSHPRKVEG
ncbi:MAG: DUF1365 domain-containing protein [Solirubrobacterales bacterium]|nr:DUF1365 domain-containing protein [Solirubrobacterales bacterium]